MEVKVTNERNSEESRSEIEYGHVLGFFTSQLGIIYFAIFRSKNLRLLSLPLAVLKLESRASLNIGLSNISQKQVLSQKKKKAKFKSKQQKKISELPVSLLCAFYVRNLKTSHGDQAQVLILKLNSN